MHLFRLDASILPATSATAELGDLVEFEWRAANPDGYVVRRHLGEEPIEARMWRDAVVAQHTPQEAWTPSQREAAGLARAYADELLDADALLFDVPLYNYGVSQHFKTWFDVVYTIDEVGTRGTALADKPAVLTTAMGGNYEPGTPRAGWDHSTPWLERVMSDVWKVDLHVVKRLFAMVGVDPALDQYAEPAAALKALAEDEARAAGRAIAGRAALLA